MISMLSVYEKICPNCGVRVWMVDEPESTVWCPTCSSPLDDRIQCLAVALPEAVSEPLVAVDWASPRPAGIALREGDLCRTSSRLR